MATYELTAYPLSLFDDYGELRVISKSALLNLLEPLNPNTTSITCKTPSYQVLIQDGLALLLMFPISGLKTFKDLCSAFFEMISRKSAGFQAVHLIFDRYHIGASFKDRTRRSRAKAGSCCVEIQSSTRIPPGMSMARILSMNLNKNALTSLIAAESQAFPWTFIFVCSWKDKAIASHGMDAEPYVCGQEEADTKIIYHLSRLPKTAEVTVLSPDTDVLVLLIRHFKEIPKETTLRLGKQLYKIFDLHEAIGRRADVITAFHSLTGCDTVRSFFREGKQVAWTAFLKANDATLTALARFQEAQMDTESLK